jgi:hypothetical protein
MNNVYFSNEGLTSTTANYYANIAKELQMAASERLNNVQMYNTSVAVIGSREKQLMSAGLRDLTFITLDLPHLASLNAFCAWVREAIKEKEEQSRDVRQLTIEHWAERMGIKLPEWPSHPTDPAVITEQDVMNTWDINKRNKYLRLEAFAATYGKYIHPDGAFSKARKRAHEVVNKPITKEGVGRDMVLYYSDLTVDPQVIDSTFMSLQDQYRSYEKELNQMKAELKESVNDLTRKAYEKYQLDVAHWKEQQKLYSSELGKLQSEWVKWRTDELERISQLKITIPNALKDIFRVIQKAGATSK